MPFSCFLFYQIIASFLESHQKYFLLHGIPSYIQYIGETFETFAKQYQYKICGSDLKVYALVRVPVWFFKNKQGIIQIELHFFCTILLALPQFILQSTFYATKILAIQFYEPFLSAVTQQKKIVRVVPPLHQILRRGSCSTYLIPYFFVNSSTVKWSFWSLINSCNNSQMTVKGFTELCKWYYCFFSFFVFFSNETLSPSNTINAWLNVLTRCTATDETNETVKSL